MDKIILILLIGIFGWWIGYMTGQAAYQPVFESDPSEIDMIFGMVVASVSGYWYMIVPR